MRYVPIPSDANGVVEIPGYSGVKATLASPGDGQPFIPDGLTLNASNISASIAASLGFGGLVVKGNAQYYLLDFCAVQHVAAPDPNDPTQYTVLGVGLRMAFSGVNVSGKAAFSLGLLAASASLSATTTAFQAKTVGIGLNTGTLPFIQALITNVVATFNVGTLQTIGGAFSQLSDYLTTAGTTLTPAPVGVVMDYDAQLQSVATSYGYALRSIEKGYPLNVALSKGVNSLPAGVSRLDPVLAALYSSVLATTDPTASPTSQQKATANSLDNCGP